mmetsp:Transcript_9642/g.16678  ORF Transcript_9642/g.16678 Transcript_9642/m.16678 type:complete len:248 (+) Transcript_9642:50-793(+)|eukprot:CAMPEP_0196666104 /NCGR_PEP_ID=MMETSP1086-20130531/63845_1 /TAXON_ID=77921 /ORGANISM="Cyanoptyche  gloeocystis , Strain SAG4.97" /LENGTH=247 /DNA_ID=CAMNT_0042003173 /DNA_START=49 /DNA_END=792 /DNA_ORIENTATION=+
MAASPTISPASPLEPDSGSYPDVVSLKSELERRMAELNAWKEAFRVDGRLEDPDPQAVKRELLNLRAETSKLQSDAAEFKRREQTLVVRLNMKEESIQELQAQLEDLRHNLTPKQQNLRLFVLDPAVNAEFKRMKDEVKNANDKVRKIQEELDATKFDQQSKTGRMLMAKCRSLQEENEELGKELSEGRIRDLEAQLAVQKEMYAKVKQNYNELNEIAASLEADVDGYQTTIEELNRQLRDKDVIAR